MEHIKKHKWSKVINNVDIKNNIVHYYYYFFIYFFEIIEIKIKELESCTYDNSCILMNSKKFFNYSNKSTTYFKFFKL